jgi:hypothetical protein
MHGGYYRPLFLHRVQVGVNAQGFPVAWKHTVVGQSLLAGTPFEAMVKNGIDESSVEGVAGSPYLEAVPAKLITLHSPRNAVGQDGWHRRAGDRPHQRSGGQCRLRAHWPATPFASPQARLASG